MSVVIKEVTSKKELKKFVKFNIELYKGNPYHVPGLIEEEMVTLDKKKNPAFEVCDAIYFLAYKDGKVVGRIAGMINRRSNETWNQKHARFGFVDFIDDVEVVDALFGAVEKWAKEQGMEAIHGPMGFTDMDHEGMLIEGFDQIGTMATIYNYPYYPKQMERMGYDKDQDWHEFKIYIPDGVPEKHLRIGEIVKKKYGLKVMKFKNAKSIMPYAQKVFQTLNESYAPLYGFARLTQKQIDYYINMYIPMLRYDLVTLIVREEDDEVGRLRHFAAEPVQGDAESERASFPVRLDLSAEGFEEQAESNRPIPDGGLAGISEQRRKRAAVQRPDPGLQKCRGRLCGKQSGTGNKQCRTGTVGLFQTRTSQNKKSIY